MNRPTLAAALTTAPYRARATMAERLRRLNAAAELRGQRRLQLAAELELGRVEAAVAAAAASE